MRRKALPALTGFALAAALAVAAPHARGEETNATDAADRAVQSAMQDDRFSFCKRPAKPLFERQRALCTLSDVEGCEGFAEACRADPGEALERSRSRDGSSGSFLQALAPLAKLLLYLLVLGIVVAIAVPIVAAIRKARRDKKLADAPRARAAAGAAVPLAPPPLELESFRDAEAALRMADEARARGEYARALGLYLAASLTALDRRGAIRIAKHRTNGEYVRFCADEGSRPPLREIVREVDRAQFGKVDPSEEAVARVAARAASLVRQAAVATLVVLAVLATGCGGVRGPRFDDPAGDELPLEVLRRSGFDVAPLGRSLATVPTGEEQSDTSEKADSAEAEVVVIDVDRVPIEEEETQAHLMRWVEGGGVLVLFGSPVAWPAELGARSANATAHEIVLDEVEVVSPTVDDDPGSYDDDDERSAPAPNIVHHETHGRIATPRAVAWTDASVVGRIGSDAYVVRKLVGNGVVIGVAGSDLFTNVGVLPEHNGAILVGILRMAGADVRLIHPERQAAASPSAGQDRAVRVRHAKREDGIPPPSTPFAALLAAGLGKGTWHALAFAIVLFLAVGIRHARPRSPEHEARRAFAEHVEATGAFWGRAKALPHALASYGRFVEMRLHERIPRGTDPASFLASRAGADAERAGRLYERATTAKDDDEMRGDELETIRELRALLVKALDT